MSVKMPVKHLSNKKPSSRRLVGAGRPASSGRRSSGGNSIGLIIGGIIGVLLLGSLLFLLVIRPQGGNKPPLPSRLPLSPQPTQINTPEGAPIAASTPAVVKTPTETPATAGTQPVQPDVAGLGQFMLELINRDRKANDLNPVAWDIIAASAGRQHA